MPKRAPYGAIKEACAMADGIGITAADLARKFGYSVHSIRSCCRDYGFTLLPERREQGSVKALVQEAHAQGMTIPQLAETSGVSKYTLYTAARRLGLTLCKARHASRRP